MRRLLILLYIGFVLTDIGPASAEEVSAEDTIRIGWSGPLTGNSAVLGQDGLTATRIVFDEINAAGGIAGRKLELFVEDDSYDTAKAVSAFSTLTSLRRVIATIMPTYGGVFATALQAVKQNVIVFNPLDCNENIAALPENTFCLATQSESVALAIGDDILRKEFVSVGLLYDQSNPFMDLVARALVTQLSGSLGVKLDSQPFAQTTSTFRSQLLRFKGQSAEAIVFLGHDPMGQAMNEAKALGLRAQFYSTGTITSPGFQKLAGAAAEGTLVAFWEAPRSRNYNEFLRKFTERTGRAPLLDLVAVPAYDTARLLVEGIRTSLVQNGVVNVEGVKAYLYSVKNYQGLSGSLTMGEDGAVRSIKEALFEFRGGRLAPLATKSKVVGE